MNADIFISFASQDRKVANILCTALESRGFGCWISSRNIQPGENFQVSIVQAIRRARIMLLVFTENSNKSEEMTKELALASQQKLIVIPLRVEDVTPNEAFSYEFATRQWIDFFADWEFAMDQLSLRIASAIGDPAAEVDTAAAPVLAPAPAPEARKPPTEAPKTTVQPTKVSAPVEGHKKPAATPPAATVQAPVERTKRPMAGLALAGAAVAVAVAVGLMLSAPKPKAPDVEPKVAILASATLMPTPPAAEEPVAAPVEVPKAKPAPKRKAPKVERHVEEEIPY